MEAKAHPRQAERLELLRSFDILDTEREPQFDDIAKLAAATCGTAISVVNLIDEDRQWFKAETGLGVRETPLATSICSHIILEDEFVEISDTLDDPRMVDNPLCCGDPGLRFYAGALLRQSGGLPIGTLCVLDYEPRSLTTLQRETLRVLADQVMAQLEMRKAIKTNEVLRKEVDHRVKNSLQSLSSFVRIQQGRTRMPETHRTLKSVSSRIDAIARLHEMLYRTGSTGAVDLGQYLAELSRHFETFLPANITLSLNAIELPVSSGQAVAVGTLANEFVANSVKHAFPEGQMGHITIDLASGGAPGTARLTCRDNGVGLDDAASLPEGGLGMFIAEVVSAELQTELEISSSGEGLTIGLEFAVANDTA